MGDSLFSKFLKKNSETEKKKDTNVKEKNDSFTLESDNLAIPEIHKKDAKHCCCNGEECDPFFEDCQPAIPEVHLKKKKKDEDNK